MSHRRSSESHSVHRDLKPDKIEHAEKLSRDFLPPSENRREVCECDWSAIECVQALGETIQPTLSDPNDVDT